MLSYLIVDQLSDKPRKTVVVVVVITEGTNQITHSDCAPHNSL